MLTYLSVHTLPLGRLGLHKSSRVGGNATRRTRAIMHAARPGCPCGRGGAAEGGRVAASALALLAAVSGKWPTRTFRQSELNTMPLVYGIGITVLFKLIDKQKPRDGCSAPPVMKCLMGRVVCLMERARLLTIVIKLLYSSFCVFRFQSPKLPPPQPLHLLTSTVERFNCLYAVNTILDTVIWSRCC